MSGDLIQSLRDLQRDALAVMARIEALTGRRRPCRTRRLWTPSEDALMRERYPDSAMPELVRLLRRSASSIYGRAEVLGLSKSAEYMAGPHACRLRREDNPGIAHRFQQGHKPWNAGAKGWKAGGRSAETRFKPGQRPHTWQPIGSERFSKEGYLQRKVTDTGYPPRDWVGVHVLLWQEHNGPVPPGHIVIFRDKNKRNITIDNLELITRAEHCRRNSIHRYPPELKATIRALGKLKRTIEAKVNEESD